MKLGLSDLNGDKRSNFKNLRSTITFSYNMCAFISEKFQIVQFGHFHQYEVLLKKIF